MRIKAIFYDFDGVIKESTDIKSKAFYELYLPYGKEVADKVVQHHIEHGGVSRFEKFKIYHKDFLNISLNENEVQELAGQFSDLVMKKVIESPYVPGAKESIVELDSSVDQFIVTGTPQNEIELIADELNLMKYFREICGSPESKISICQNLLDNYNYSPNEVLFIGDATTDLDAATYHKFHFLLREHDENTSLFKGFDLTKAYDLTTLVALIQKI